METDFKTDTMYPNTWQVSLGSRPWRWCRRDREGKRQLTPTSRSAYAIVCMNALVVCWLSNGAQWNTKITTRLPDIMRTVRRSMIETSRRQVVKI